MPATFAASSHSQPYNAPDPWMIFENGVFYLTCTLGDRVEIWKSLTMENFTNCGKSIVWKPPPNSPWSADIWAPELHRLDGNWYIYFAGAQPGLGNSSHRTLLLKSEHPNPMHTPSWVFLGPLEGMPDHWSIDATIFSPSPDEFYCCYSGWPLGDHSDTEQDLFLVKMASPEMALRETLVCISKPQLTWERIDDGKRGVNEGPTWVDVSPAFRGIVYSASGSWSNEYKLGLLQITGHNPLQVESWSKRSAPLMASNHQAPFGPGHASFIKSSCGRHVYCIYHGTQRADDGWNNRKARVICMSPSHFTGQAETFCCAVGSSLIQMNGQGKSEAPGGQHLHPRRGRRKSDQRRDFFNKLKTKLREL